MKNNKIKNEIMLMINMMSDSMPFYDFNILKHTLLSKIDKSKRRKRIKATDKYKWP